MSSRLLPLVLAFAGALGCTTTLSGTRDTPKARPSDGKDPAPLEGVPVQLTSPTFALVQKPAADGKPVTYTLTVAYRPDPSQRYLVNIEPFRLSSTELSVSLGPAGQLSALNGSVTSQVSATVNAIGEFAVGALGVAAKAAGVFAAADKGRPKEFQDIAALLSAVDVTDVPRLCELIPAKKGGAAGKRAPPPPGKADAPKPSARVEPVPQAADAKPLAMPVAAPPAGAPEKSGAPAEQIAAYLRLTGCPEPRETEKVARCKERLACVRRSLVASLDADLKEDGQAGALYPLSQEEAIVLAGAAQRAKVADDALGRNLDSKEDAFVKAATSGAAGGGSGGGIPSAYGDPAPPQKGTDKQQQAIREDAARAAVVDLTAAVKAASLDRLAEVQCPLDLCAKPEGDTAKPEGDAAKPVGDAASHWNDAKELAELRIREGRLRAALDAAARLSPDEWRARHVQKLERRIAWRLGRAGSGGDAADMVIVRDLQRKLAITIDALPEYERAVLLERRLATPLDVKADSAAIAAREAARKELQSLQAVIAQKRQALRPASRAEAKPQEREVRLEPVRKTDGLPATASWARTEAARRGNPEFLLVVEKGTQP